MIFKGEKWACEACVRGHRVSNCNHSDRPLQHINKKGRPVTQCAHCRAQRKSRQSHVKCDCGEKTSKCAHLQQTPEGHTDTCCCNHGGKCSCCGKREPALDTVPEAEADDNNPNKVLPRPKLPNRRRRANTIHSDNMMSFDANGNRKPVKHNRTSQQVGPYQLNRVNSAGASMDSFTEGRKGVDAQRRVKSEATSPMLQNSGFQMNSAVPPLDLSNIDYGYTNSGPPSAFDLFGAGFSPDNDAPLYSAGLNPPQSVDWAQYDFAGQNDAFGPSSYSAAGTQGFGNFPDYASNSEYLPNLVNTTSNSGDVSEAGDWNPNVYNNGLDISNLDRDSFYKDADQDPNALGQTSFFDQDAVFIPNYYDGQDGLADETVNQMGTETMWNIA